MTKRSLALIALAVILALASLATGYVKRELAEPEAFAARSVDALRSEEVREVIAEQVAVEMLERGSPDLVASRPLVLTAVEAVLETDQFARVLRRAAVTAHAVLMRGDRDVIVELEEANDVLVPAVESVSPELARQLPTELSPRIAEIRGSDAATWAVRVADGATTAALPLLVVALAAFGLAVAYAPDRRRAGGAAGLALAVGAGVGLGAMGALRAQVLSHAEQLGVLSDEDARAAAGAAWDALAGGLEQWLLVVGIAGLAVAAGAVLAERGVDRSAALRRASDVVAGARLAPALSMLRGLALAALGALILLEVEPVFAAVILVVGGTLVLLGLAELLSMAGGTARTPRLGARRRRRAAAASAAALAAGAAVAVALLSGGGPPTPPAEGEISACNGLPELCDRRLDEVVLSGTHNSMAAADRPGWFFANQVRPIPRQLRDGIRLLMIDPHYGVVDSQGRVRTDLRAEGTDRNRVARRLGAEAVGVAERLAGRLALVPTEGDREIFLCHTLCELGAERMSSTLDEIRGFLERNRFEVLVVLLESSVDAHDVEHEVEEADLAPYLTTLRRGDPLPTLRGMIASGRRLVILSEGDGGDAPWHQPGFVFLQDTKIDSLLESPTACLPNRGTRENPILLMNHWIDRFPPPLGENRDLTQRRALMRRVRSCRRLRGRAPNLIAVDFYDRGDVVDVARELNRDGRRG
jgi:hypothetical protein